MKTSETKTAATSANTSTLTEQQKRLLETPLDGLTRINKTHLFETKKLKVKLADDLKTGIITKDQFLAAYKAHTLLVEFSFDGLTIGEIIECLTSTTTLLKRFINNEAGKWNESIILETVSKGIYHVSARTLLDERKTHESDPMRAIGTNTAKAIAKGMTPEEILAAVKLQLGMK